MFVKRIWTNMYGNMSRLQFRFPFSLPTRADAEWVTLFVLCPVWLCSLRRLWFRGWNSSTHSQPFWKESSAYASRCKTFGWIFQNPHHTGENVSWGKRLLFRAHCSLHPSTFQKNRLQTPNEVQIFRSIKMPTTVQNARKWLKLRLKQFESWAKLSSQLLPNIQLRNIPYVMLIHPRPGLDYNISGFFFFLSTVFQIPTQTCVTFFHNGNTYFRLPTAMRSFFYVYGKNTLPTHDVWSA